MSSSTAAVASGFRRCASASARALPRSSRGWTDDGGISLREVRKGRDGSESLLRPPDEEGLASISTVPEKANTGERARAGSREIDAEVFATEPRHRGGLIGEC